MATPAQRAKAIIDALANTDVPAQTAVKWVRVFWDYYGPDTDENGDAIAEPTNAQLSIFFVRKLRHHLREVASANRAPTAAGTARLQELADVESEAASELGED